MHLLVVGERCQPDSRWPGQIIIPERGALSNLGLKPGKEYYSREFPFSRLLAAGIKGGKGLKVSIKEGKVCS